MDPLNSHIIQQIGISIIHSLWQIGLITFIYFYFTVLRKRISVNQKYKAGLVLLFIVLVSFVLTFQFVHLHSVSENQASSGYSISPPEQELPLAEEQPEVLNNTANGKSFFIDIVMSDIRHIIYQIAGFIGLFWMFGLLILVFRKVLAFYTLQGVKNNKHNVRSAKWEHVLLELSHRLNIKKQVKIIFSPFVNSPFSFGFLKPVILFPLRLTTGLTNEEIKCILIHELAHNLRNDYLFNIFQHVIEVLFFYHPGIWWMSDKIRIHREMICDKIVLDSKVSEKFYANTLLKLGELKVKDANLASAAKRSDKELFSRIKYIITKSDTTTEKRKVNPLILLIFLLGFLASGFIKQGNETGVKPVILYPEISESLSPFHGSFTMYDLKDNQFYSSDDSLCNLRYPAYSTFKLAGSLMAFDLGIAEDESYTLEYDSIKYPLPQRMKEDAFLKHWFESHNMETALYYSVNWYFIELGERIGGENMKAYLDKLRYGNRKMAYNGEPSWYNGQLKISATEQVKFLKDLLKRECRGISDDAQELTQQIIPGEEEENYVLYGKTGTGQIADGRYIGWLVGYLETEENTYAYAFNIVSDDINKISGSKRRGMVKAVFREMGLLAN